MLSFISNHQKLRAIMIFQPLASLLKQNIMLIDALSIMIESTHAKSQRQSLKKIQQWLQSGLSFSQALRLTSKRLSPYQLTMIQLGEQSQQLALCLTQLHQHHQHQKQIKNQLYQACFYPCLTLITALVISIALLTKVLPSCFDIYQQQQQALPPLTATLAHISFWISHEGLRAMTLALILMASLAFIQIQLKKTSAYEQLIKKTPLVFTPKPKLLTHFRYSNICFMLALGLDQSLSFSQILSLTANSQSHASTQTRLNLWLSYLHQGHPPHIATELTKGLPSLLKQSIAISKDQKNLAENLRKLSQHLLESSQQQAEKLIRWLNPILLLVTATLVGTIMAGIYLPIFEMGSAF